MTMNNIKKKTSNIDKVDFANITFGKTFIDHMIVAKYENKKWGKAELLPYGPLSLSPAISALHYGQAVFEGVKAFYTKRGELTIFRPKDHEKRINRSLTRLAMPELPEGMLTQSLEMLIKKDAQWLRRAGVLYVRPFVFATEAYLGVKVSDEYLFMILACPAGKYYSKPLNLKIETEFSRSAPGGVGAAKAAGNYAASMHPTRLAQQAGFDQLIWTDAVTHTYIEESGTMNVMCVIDGVLTTPALSETILSGLTRDSVLKVAKDLGIKVKERKISVAELIKGLTNGKVSEVFGAGTAVTIAPCASITYKSKKYNLPDVGEQSIAKKIAHVLDSIKRGEANDKHGWVHVIRP
ncbi:MAG: branched-chain amino acid aminotransferase [Candidatus Taylorbacteria bacterium]|nr:branched-chain amino acid aminotransferase [Candidatus Taylorbacteria bacterium]